MMSYRSTARLSRHLRWAVLPLLALTSGCDAVVMNPSGDIAVQQWNLIMISTGLMLIVIVPVIILTLLFAWHYRQGNAEATYEPNWNHSTQLELVIWSIPLLIIISLGAITWVSTHLLDPYRPIARIAPQRGVAANAKTLDVEVVALDWKWLFIYPQLGIATVNELAAPLDTPIRFKITASTVMNSFYIPALAGQIYAMPGMETTLNAVINKPGDFAGFSANYSGAGFSDMKFRFHGLSQADFDRWVQSVKASGQTLNRPGYLQLEKPSERDPVRRYASVAPDLFGAVVSMCVRPGQTCMAPTMGEHGHGGEKTTVSGSENPKGALMRAPEDKGSAPHWTEPRETRPPGVAGPKGPDAKAPNDKTPGVKAPAGANRNLTMNSAMPAPGSPELARS